MRFEEHRQRLREVREVAHAHAHRAGFRPGFGRMVGRAVWYCLVIPLAVAYLAFAVAPPALEAAIAFRAAISEPIAPKTAAAVRLYAPLATALPALLLGIIHVAIKGRQ
jgi:hypothetical protein